MAVTSSAPGALQHGPTLGWGLSRSPSSSDECCGMRALRRTALAGELAALNGRLVDLLLGNASAAELKALQDEVRVLLDELEAEAAEESVTK
jgi:hypothetical protein